MEMKKVALTGITGKSGRYAVERLVERRNELDGVTFTAVVRSAQKAAWLTECGLQLELIEGSVDDDVTLKRAFAGADTLLHIVGVHTSELVVKTAIEAGLHRVIVVHTTGVYSKYKSANAAYKRIDASVTQMCADAGVALSILRPTMIYGGVDDENVVKFIAMMDRFPIMPTVEGARFALQPVHRRDLGRAYADVLLSPNTLGKDYVLSGREPIQLRDMLTIIAGYLGKPARFLSVPYAMAITLAWGLYLLSFSKLDYREKVQRLVEPRAYPHDEATRDFGYAPMGFDEGVKDEVGAYLRLHHNATKRSIG